jgi:hypothetical protein
MLISRAGLSGGRRAADARKTAEHARQAFRYGLRMTVRLELVGDEPDVNFVDGVAGPSYFYDLQPSGVVRVIACQTEAEMIRTCTTKVAYGPQAYLKVQGHTWRQDVSGYITVLD